MTVGIWYTLLEISDKTGLHYETVRRHAVSGSLVAHKHGGIWLVSDDALISWLKARRISG